MNARRPPSSQAARWLAGVLCVALLTGAQAERQAPTSHPPRPPLEVLSFTETQQVLGAAAQVAAELRAGTPRLLRTPQGRRLALPLLYQGQVVSYALLGEGGHLMPLRRGPSLPDSPVNPSISAADLSRLDAQLRRLTLSGSVQATRRDYQVLLLLGGQPVATLRLDRQTLHLKNDPGLLGQPLHPAPHQR